MRNGKGSRLSSLGEWAKRHGAGSLVTRQRVCSEQEVS